MVPQTNHLQAAVVLHQTKITATLNAIGVGKIISRNGGWSWSSTRHSILWLCVTQFLLKFTWTTSSVASKKILHWLKFCFDAHAIAQPCMQLRNHADAQPVKRFELWKRYGVCTRYQRRFFVQTVVFFTSLERNLSTYNINTHTLFTWDI